MDKLREVTIWLRDSDLDCITAYVSGKYDNGFGVVLVDKSYRPTHFIPFSSIVYMEYINDGRKE